MGERLRTVFFDLDGTLVDTAPDLHFALSRVLEEEGDPPVPFERLRPVVSLGGKAMLELAFGGALEPERYQRLRGRFLGIYREHIAVRSRLFPGMAPVLDALAARGMSWGVVTNKATWLTEPLLASLGLRQRAACVVSGDTTAHLKPHPAPLLHASQAAGTPPAACVYLGDAVRDVAAGRSAGMRTLIALFGYIPLDTDPAAWGADGAIAAPADLLPWLDGAA